MQQRLSNEPVAEVHIDITDLSLGVWVSFGEIYNEYIYDLLAPRPARGQSRPKLPLGYSNGNFFIKNLTTVNVTSGLEAYQILQYGLHNLKYAATSINDHSSRSHSIFTIKLAQASDSRDGVHVSSFNFCDLAGSERLKNTNNIGDRLKESNNINTSLLVLGKCVHAVRESQKTKHNNQLIPFRESKLTQLFQTALLGKEAISMIVNISPTREMFDESHHVLSFSAIAKDVAVKQQPFVQRLPMNRFTQLLEIRGSNLSSAQDTDSSMIEELQMKIADLYGDLEEEKLTALEHRDHIISEYKELLQESESHWEEKYKQLENKLACMEAELEDKERQIPKRRKMSIVVLDSSTEEDEPSNNISTTMANEFEKCTNENYIQYKKENAELKLMLKFKDEEIRKLNETLSDAVVSYKHLQSRYETEIFNLQKNHFLKHDEANQLTSDCDSLEISYVRENDDLEECDDNGECDELEDLGNVLNCTAPAKSIREECDDIGECNDVDDFSNVWNCTAPAKSIREECDDIEECNDVDDLSNVWNCSAPAKSISEVYSDQEINR